MLTEIVRWSKRSRLWALPLLSFSVFSGFMHLIFKSYTGLKKKKNSVVESVSFLEWSTIKDFDTHPPPPKRSANYVSVYFNSPFLFYVFQFSFSIFYSHFSTFFWWVGKDYNLIKVTRFNKFWVIYILFLSQYM